MEQREYQIETNSYDNAAVIPTNCIDILFYNEGTVKAFVNDFPIPANTTIPIVGVIGDIYKKGINLTFENVAGTKRVWVMRRTYINS